MGNRRQKLGLAAACGAVLIAGMLAPTASVAAGAEEQPVSAPPSLLAAQFSVPVTFDRAVELSEAYVGEAVGVRFENHQVVGEYFFESDKTPEEFLLQFEEMYGTQPQAAALVVEVPRRSANDTARRMEYEPLPIIPVAGEPFEAPLVPEEKFGFIREAARGDSVTAGEATPENRGDAQAADASLLAFTPTWEPATVYAGTYRQGSSQYFYNSLDWYTPNSPSRLTGPYAVEVEINLTNGASGVRGSVLPHEVCGPNFRDQFLAKNYSLNSWSAFSPLGGVARAYPYADLNDLFDSCGMQSMAIGFADAVQLPTGPAGPTSTLETFIDAKIGNQTSSGVWGRVALSNNSMCDFHNMTFAWTDCVGIAAWGSQPFPAERLTLGPQRAERATPHRCWISGGHGQGPLMFEFC